MEDQDQVKHLTQASLSQLWKPLFHMTDVHFRGTKAFVSLSFKSELPL